jgi:hypothetical protein
VSAAGQQQPIGLLGSNAREAQLWECLAVEHSAVQPEGTPFDPAITAAIREFDPFFVPIWSRKCYRAPTGEQLVMGYHTISRWLNHPVLDSYPLKLVAIPEDWPFPSSQCVYEVRTWAIPWPKGTPQRKAGWPDIFLPCDWDIHKFCRDVHFTLHANNLTPEFFHRMAVAEHLRDMQRLAGVIADHRLRVKDDRRQFQRAFDEGRIYDPPKDPQPYVQVPRQNLGEAG